MLSHLPDFVKLWLLSIALRRFPNLPPDGGCGKPPYMQSRFNAVLPSLGNLSSYCYNRCETQVSVVRDAFLQ